MAIPRDVLVVAIAVFAASAGFALGYLAGQDAHPAFSISERSPADAELGIEAAVPSVAPAAGAKEGEVVASSKGSKYYLPWCAGATKISSANRITFASAEEAKAAGYSPAANCK